MGPWESLVKYYDGLVERREKVCPIAHTYITTHMAVLLDRDGNFLCAMDPEVKNELIPVPCTIESENRTSGIAPHLISDQLQYVANYPGYEKHHRAYIEQLERYVSKNPADEYARAVFSYVEKGNLMDDISDIIPKKQGVPKNKLNIIFAVYGLPNEGIDHEWTDYYVNSVLKPNGRCSITGETDYIPKTYPNNILAKVDIAKLFSATGDSYNITCPNLAPGYKSSQKIIHALQYMLYAKNNANRVEAEYNIRAFQIGDMTEEKLREWVEREYPRCWDEFIKILKEEEKEAVGN